MSMMYYMHGQCCSMGFEMDLGCMVKHGFRKTIVAQVIVVSISACNESLCSIVCRNEYTLSRVSSQLIRKFGLAASDI